jgi:azurin
MNIRTLALATLLAASANAFAANTCKVEITGSDAMQYDKKEISPTSK